MKDETVEIVEAKMSQLQLLKRLQQLNEELDRKIAMQAGKRPRPWHTRARATQLAPSGDDWNIWLILAGRGWGKRTPERTGSPSRPHETRTQNGRLSPPLGETAGKRASKALPAY